MNNKYKFNINLKNWFIGGLISLVLGGFIVNGFSNYIKSQDIKKKLSPENLTNFSTDEINTMRKQYFLYKSRIKDPHYEN
ncbi:MAG: hypothetical protein P8X70_03145 [Nanoarchaeota archaeon]|jgi:hypothetical protein